MANVVRIVGIFYVGVYAPRLIPFFHNVLGEALMILLVLITWSLWAKRISGAVPGGSFQAL
jgi:exosortase/archaeosortase family protein